MPFRLVASSIGPPVNQSQLTKVIIDLSHLGHPPPIVHQVVTRIILTQRETMNSLTAERSKYYTITRRSATHRFDSGGIDLSCATGQNSSDRKIRKQITCCVPRVVLSRRRTRNLAKAGFDSRAGHPTVNQAVIGSCFSLGVAKVKRRRR